MWKPKEIIINEKVKDDPVTKHILNQCKGIPVKIVKNGKPKTIVEASDILKNVPNNMLDIIIAGKKVLYIAPPGSGIVDQFKMPDVRMLCPHFDRVRFASNGCYYLCDWCYLKLTYRAAFPFITVYVGYQKIEHQLYKRLNQTPEPVIFNSGELADSLALEHLTGAAQHFISWFAKTGNGYLFMLTKSTNVDDILNLEHNGHTIISWSLNNEQISRKFEIGAPAFQNRLAAAVKVQKAGYPLRVRLDPIIPIDGWQKAYSKTIEQIFENVNPERITIGTLRFEKGFYNMRNNIFTTGDELKNYLEGMTPMFDPKVFPDKKNPQAGKYSFSEEKRTEIFNFAINEIRKYSDCKIALCKESSAVWENTGLDRSRCSCVCQLDHADMSQGEARK